MSERARGAGAIVEANLANPAMPIWGACLSAHRPHARIFSSTFAEAVMLAALGCSRAIRCGTGSRDCVHCREKKSAPLTVGDKSRSSCSICIGVGCRSHCCCRHGWRRLLRLDPSSRVVHLNFATLHDSSVQLLPSSIGIHIGGKCDETKALQKTIIASKIYCKSQHIRDR